MKQIISFLPLAILPLMLCLGCSDKEESSDDMRDQELPVITTEGITASPSDCDAYRHGDTIHFCYRFTDNECLGNYNIEIHGNHDHHTHSTSAVDCKEEHEEEHGEVVKPWVYNQDFAIPANSRDYTARVDIVVPDDVDGGDYHFMIRVTDQAGWQQLRSVAIEID